MQSAENGFKKHHLIPMNSQEGSRFPRVTSREEKLSSTILSKFERKKNPFHVTFTPALLWQTMKFFRKRKWTRNRLKCHRMHHLHFFSKKLSGRSRTPPPLQLQKGCSLTHPPRRIVNWPNLANFCHSNGRFLCIDNAMYIFNAILLKIQLSLSEFKRLYLHSRLHHFAPFLQNFLGGGPPNPHQREGTPLPYPPHSALRASRTPPPRLSSGFATDEESSHGTFHSSFHLK